MKFYALFTVSVSLMGGAACVSTGEETGEQESQDLPWLDRLEYVGIAVEEPGYHVWGSMLVQWLDGRLLVCIFG